MRHLPQLLLRFFPRELPFAGAVLLGLSLFGLVLAGAFTVGYRMQVSETVEIAGRQLFEERQANISSRLNALFYGPQFLASTLAAAPIIKSGDLASSEPMLLAQLSFDPSIVNIKIGNESGLYFSGSRIEETPDTRYYTPPPGAAYAMVTISPDSDGTYTQLTEFRRGDLTEMPDRSTTPSTTDVRNLDWYALGRESAGKLRWIGRAVPGGVGARISFLIGFEAASPGAIAIDIGYRDVAKVLAGVRSNASEHLVIFDETGAQYGSTSTDFEQDALAAGLGDPDLTPDSIIGVIYDQFKSTGPFGGRDIDVAGKAHFVSVMPVDLHGDNGMPLFIGMAVSREQLERPLRENWVEILTLLAVILVLSVPLVYLVSRKLSEPLRHLRTQADETLKLRFDGAAQLESSILEVKELSASGLTAFFVPVDLRELTLTEGADDGETWIRCGADCFQVKADRGADGARQDCGIGVQGCRGVAAELLSLA